MSLGIAYCQVVATLLLLLTAEHVELTLHLLHLTTERHLRVLSQSPLDVAIFYITFQPLTLYPRLNGISAVGGITGVGASLIVLQGHLAQPLYGLAPLAQAHVLGTYQVVHLVKLEVLQGFQRLFHGCRGWLLTVVEVLLQRLDLHGVDGIFIAVGVDSLIDSQ